MKTIDLKSLLIGFLSTVIMFMTTGMRQTATPMGDIAVNSITVIGENEEKALFIGSGGGGNGYLKTYNKFGKTSSYLGTGGGGTGGFKIYNRDGKTLAFISGDKEGKGFLEISNSNGDPVSSLSANDNNAGHLTLNDADGNTYFDSENTMSGDASLGDVTVNSLSVIDGENTLKMHLGIDDEKNGYLRVTHEIEDYYYPSDEPKIDLETFGDITVKSITITDNENTQKAFLGLDDKQNGQLKLSNSDLETIYPILNEDKSEFGDITVKSLTITDDENIPKAFLGVDDNKSGLLTLTGQEKITSLPESLNLTQEGLGDIRVSSITVVNNQQSTIGYFGPSMDGKGNLRTIDSEGNVMFSTDETSSKKGNLGNIRVNSITVEDGAENEYIYIGSDDALNGLISVANADGDVTFTTDKKGKDASNLGDIKVNSITVLNEYNTPTTFIGNTPEGSGRLEVNDFTGVTVFSSENSFQRGDDFGEIKVRSLEVINRNQETMLTLGSSNGEYGLVRAKDKTGKEVFSSDNISAGTKSNGESGNIVAKSITLVDDKDEVMGYMGVTDDGLGELRFYGSNESETLVLGTNVSEQGFLRTYNQEGTQTLYIGTSESGDGLLKTYGSTGKKMTFLGTRSGYGGIFNTYNNFGDVAGMFGTSGQNGGSVNLFNSSGKNIFSVIDSSGSTFTKGLITSDIRVVDGLGVGKVSIGLNENGEGFVSTNTINSDTTNSKYNKTHSIKSSEISIVNEYNSEKIFLGTNNEDTGFIKTNLSNGDIDFLSSESSKVSENLGDVQVNSLTVINPEGDMRVFVGRSQEGNGIISTKNEIGAQTSFIGTDIDGSGKFEVGNATGQKIATIGTSVKDGGALTTYNRNNEITAILGISEDGVTGHLSNIDHIETLNQVGFKTIYLGNGQNDEGLLKVFNAEGVQSTLMGSLSTGGGLITSNSKGLITSFLGTSGSNGGHIITYNSYGKKTSFVGTNKHNDGMVILRDKGGNIGWGKDGRIATSYARR